MKVIELEGQALNAAVAKLEGLEGGYLFQKHYSPSTDWATGGPIIEHERISVYFRPFERPEEQWCAGTEFELTSSPEYESGGGFPMVDFKASAAGPTLLIAAMRAYVASKS